MASPDYSRLLTRLNELVSARMGLRFGPDRRADLERGVTSAARESGFSDNESYVESLLSTALSKSQLEVLARNITVGETYFFREPQTFVALEKNILPELIRSRAGEKRLRIWSAGCSTGEEPYSLAILLCRLITDPERWNITIMATDINSKSLRMAGQGVYSEWSFRDCPAWVRKGYFRNAGNSRFEISPDVRKMVTFACHNLGEDAYPSLLNGTNAMDLIFCRNVLMYFTPEVARRAVEGFRQCLVDGGWLVLSPSEVSLAARPGLSPVAYPDVIVYRKAELKPAQMPDTVSKRIEAGSMPAIGKVKSVRALPARKGPPPAEVETVTYELALALFEQGDYAEAGEKTARIVESGCADSRVLLLLARVCANQGRLLEACAWCQRSISADRLDPTRYFLLATVLQESGRIDEAIGALKRALYLDRGFVLAHFALGVLTDGQGKPGVSRRHFDNALSLLGRYPQDDVLPGAEGITAGRLAEVTRLRLETDTTAIPVKAGTRSAIDTPAMESPTIR